MGAFLIGPFMIKHIYVVILLSAIAAYFAVKWTARDDKSFQQLLLNTIVNGVLIWFVIFKFSTILFQPSLLLESPFSIIYFTGGIKGAILGIVFAIIYLYLIYKKGKWELKKWAASIVYGIVTFFITFWSMRTLLILIY